MTISTTQLLYLQTALDKGSLRAAATLLGVSQPTLSIQIRRLEEELNIVLLKRTSGGVDPTPEAARLLPYMEAVTAAHEALERMAVELRSPTRGTVRVGVISHFNYHIAPRILADVHARYPEATVELVEAGAVKIMEMVHSGDLDMGLIVRTPDAPPTPEKLRFVDLATGDLHVCLSDEDPLAELETVQMEHLRGRSMVSHSPETTMRAIFDSFQQAYDLTAVTFTDSGPATPRLVATSGLPAFSTSSDFRISTEVPRVHYRPLTDPTTTVILSAVLRSGEQSTALVRAVTRELRRQRRELPWPSGFTAV